MGFMKMLFGPTIRGMKREARSVLREYERFLRDPIGDSLRATRRKLYRVGRFMLDAGYFARDPVEGVRRLIRKNMLKHVARALKMSRW